MATCPVAIASCTCKHEENHPDPVHECSNEECNGAWIGTSQEDPTFKVVRFPGMPEGTTTEDALIDTIVRMLGGT